MPEGQIADVIPREKQQAESGDRDSACYFSQSQHRLLPLRKALIAIDPRGLEIQKLHGGQRTFFQVGLHQPGGEKAAADAGAEVVGELSAVVDLEGKLVEGRKQLPDKLAHLLEGEVAEQVIQGGQVLLSHRVPAAGIVRGGHQKQLLGPEEAAAEAGFLEGLVGENQIQKTVLQIL